MTNKLVGAKEIAEVKGNKDLMLLSCKQNQIGNEGIKYCKCSKGKYSLEVLSRIITKSATEGAKILQML